MALGHPALPRALRKGGGQDSRPRMALAIARRVRNAHPTVLRKRGKQRNFLPCAKRGGLG